jgi:hypothetical protein
MSSTTNLASFQAAFPSPVYGGGMFATSYYIGAANATLYLPLYNQIGTIYVTAKDSGGSSVCTGTFLTNSNINYLSYDTTQEVSGTLTGVGFYSVYLLQNNSFLAGTISCWVNKGASTGTSAGNYGVQFTCNFANTDIDYISVVYIGTGEATALTTSNPNPN